MEALNNINLNNNQILNLVLQNETTDPSSNIKSGKIIYNSADNRIKYSDGYIWNTLANDIILTFNSSSVDSNTANTIKNILKDIFEIPNMTNLFTLFRKKYRYGLYDCKTPFIIEYIPKAYTNSDNITYNDKYYIICNVNKTSKSSYYDDKNEKRMTCTISGKLHKGDGDLTEYCAVATYNVRISDNEFLGDNISIMNTYIKYGSVTPTSL